MSYNFEIKNADFSNETNAMVYSGPITIDGVAGYAHYYEPVIGIPCLSITEKKVDEKNLRDVYALRVDLRTGYEPSYLAGKRAYGMFFRLHGDDLLAQYARAAHNTPITRLDSVMEYLSRDLKLLLQTENYKLIWKPREINGVPYDGTLAVGTDAHLRTPKILIYFKFERYTPRVIMLYGIPGLTGPCRLVSIDDPDLAPYNSIPDDARVELLHVLRHNGIPAKEIWEAKKSAREAKSQ